MKVKKGKMGCETYVLLCGSASSIEHTVHIDIVDVLEILVSQVYCRFDNGDASILIAHIMRLKKSMIRFWGKELGNYRNKASDRAQLRVYRLESLIDKLCIRNITFVCLRKTTKQDQLSRARVFSKNFYKKKRFTLAFTLNSLATFSTTSGASAELLIITSLSERYRNKQVEQAPI